MRVSLASLRMTTNESGLPDDEREEGLPKLVGPLSLLRTLVVAEDICGEEGEECDGDDAVQHEEGGVHAGKVAG
jgi:hypothetical protein